MMRITLRRKLIRDRRNFPRNDHRATMFYESILAPSPGDGEFFTREEMTRLRAQQPEPVSAAVTIDALDNRHSVSFWREGAVE